jgi:phosphopantothenate-cysteine ligase
MNILITSGGTTERIDAVRGIANRATGRLGSLIAEQFKGETVFYICAAQSLKPCTDAEITAITDTLSLENALRGILASNRVDAIIHAMAVSDYRVKAVHNSLGEELDRQKKISSDEKELTVYLEQTPKIISLLRVLSPNAVIIGFKLLDNAPENLLLAAASKLMQDNRCDFILANDQKDISGDSHIGILLDKNGGTKTFFTKQDIAAGIAAAVREAIA